MTTLERLKEKITKRNTEFENLVIENQDLKEQLLNTDGEKIDGVEFLQQQLELKNKCIQELREEMLEKDHEIEAIIAKVESYIE